MELFDEWTTAQRLLLKANPRRNIAPAVSAGEVFEALKGCKLPILNVHCYTDMKYRWVQVVFDRTIGPGVALRVGQTLVDLAGEDKVFFNSLRPQAVYFLFEPALEAEPGLDASRYGAKLADIEAVWPPVAVDASPRSGARGVSAAKRGRASNRRVAAG